MDINTLRIMATVAAFIVFVLIVAWVWRKRNSKDYREAANLPFNED